MASAIGIACAHSMMAVNFLAGDNVIVALLGLCLFMASFSSGYGPTTWVLASEIFPLSHRGAGMGCATFVNRFLSGVVAISFLSLQRALTPAGTFTMLACVALLALAFTWCVRLCHDIYLFGQKKRMY